MTYSGANQARTARENLGRALEALQQDPNIPDDVLAVAQNIAQAVGALFQAERAPGEPEGKGFIRQSLGSLSQTLALLQDVRGQHRGIEIATEAIAGVMGVLYPLTNVPTHAPPGHPMAQPVLVPQAAPVPQIAQAPAAFAPPPASAPVAAALAPAAAPASLTFGQPAPAAQPAFGQPAPAAQPAFGQPAPAAQPAFGQPAPAAQPAFGQPAPAAQPAFGQPAPAAQPAFGQPAAQPAFTAPAAAPAAHTGPKGTLEANIGATTESNFYVGFSGEIAEGGVFVATYEAYPKGTPVRVLVTLPGGFEFQVDGHVRFVRDPMDFSSDSEPGMGVQFENLSADARQLVLRFIQKRAPIFFDD
ncbi:MAG: PilZ domain-containing protein [Polyangiales bacterium]